MTTTKQEPGVLGEAAAPLGVTRWVDASGQALEHFDLDRMPGRFKLIFCFQDACPGCHATGFPALARVVDAFRGSDFVGFAAVQTVFEDFGSNTWERMLANHSRYALGIPFGHDAGDEQDGAGSELMRRYRKTLLFSIGLVIALGLGAIAARQVGLSLEPQYDKRVMGVAGFIVVGLLIVSNVTLSVTSTVLRAFKTEQLMWPSLAAAAIVMLAQLVLRLDPVQCLALLAVFNGLIFYPFAQLRLNAQISARHA